MAEDGAEEYYQRRATQKFEIDPQAFAVDPGKMA